jgi:hypothetical protein
MSPDLRRIAAARRAAQQEQQVEAIMERIRTAAEICADAPIGRLDVRKRKGLRGPVEWALNWRTYSRDKGGQLFASENVAEFDQVCLIAVREFRAARARRISEVIAA